MVGPVRNQTGDLRHKGLKPIWDVNANHSLSRAPHLSVFTMIMSLNIMPENWRTDLFKFDMNKTTSSA